MIHPEKCGIQAELIDVPAVKRHLTETGWTQFKTKRKDISIFQYTKSGRFEQVTVPNDRSLSDYCTALCQAIETIADFEDVPTEQLLQKLMCENIRQRFPEIIAELPDEPTKETLHASARAEAGVPSEVFALEDSQAQKSFNCRLVLHIPKELHQNLAAAAREHGMSLNQYVLSRLS